MKRICLVLSGIGLCVSSGFSEEPSAATVLSNMKAAFDKLTGFEVRLEQQMTGFVVANAAAKGRWAKPDELFLSLERKDFTFTRAITGASFKTTKPGDGVNKNALLKRGNRAHFRSEPSDAWDKFAPSAATTCSALLEVNDIAPLPHSTMADIMSRKSSAKESDAETLESVECRVVTVDGLSGDILALRRYVDGVTTSGTGPMKKQAEKAVAACPTDGKASTAGCKLWIAKEGDRLMKLEVTTHLVILAAPDGKGAGTQDRVATWTLTGHETDAKAAVKKLEEAAGLSR